ncbi:MAG: hypothetical protein JWL71_1200 [Acidobacteria bacterium]|nr:hypothetical protein [Acidobacteriota bacterium]
MSHFDITDWTDFGRGCAAEVDRAAMQAHLGTGCRRCRALVDMVRRIVATARPGALQEPPPDIVRCAKALSALQRPRSTTGWRVGRLIFDSFREPLPAGVRAEDRGSRHAVFEAGDFLIDLRLEQEPGVVTLVGQLTNRVNPGTVLTAAPVLVMARHDVVAHAVYNRFGEFQMDYPPARDLRLCLAPPDQRIEVSLNMFAGSAPGKKRVRGSRMKKP